MTRLSRALAVGAVAVILMGCTTPTDTQAPPSPSPVQIAGGASSTSPGIAARSAQQEAGRDTAPEDATTEDLKDTKDTKDTDRLAKPAPNSAPQARGLQGAAGSGGDDAMVLLRRGAESGDAASQFLLALEYRDGSRVEPNEAEFEKWIHAAADQGYLNAQIYLRSIAEAVEAAKNPYVSEEVEKLLSDAQAGSLEAQVEVGRRFERGDGAARDPARAFYWYSVAAERDDLSAQVALGGMYTRGDGVQRDATIGASWYLRAAERGDATAEFTLGLCYQLGRGVDKDLTQARSWLQKAAQHEGASFYQVQLGDMLLEGDLGAKDPISAVEYFAMAARAGDSSGQRQLAQCLRKGVGTFRDPVAAANWMALSADQGSAFAQRDLGVMYATGEGVTKDLVLAHAWLNIAASHSTRSAGRDSARLRDELATQMTRSQVAEAEAIARGYAPRSRDQAHAPEGDSTEQFSGSTGSGFFVTSTGHFVTCAHVIEGGQRIEVVIAGRSYPAEVLCVDEDADIAVLRCQGTFSALPLRDSKKVRIGDLIHTVGFPNPSLQGKAAKYSSGTVAALSGVLDDDRCFQVSLPVQPGNSGGALIDSTGAVVGVVAARLDESVTLKATGVMPENVNYAVKQSLLLALLSTVPGLTGELAPATDVLLTPSEVAELAATATGFVIVHLR